MSLNIKNPEAHELAKELSALTGETMTDAVTVALRERVTALKRRKQSDKEARLAAVMKLLDKLDNSAGITSASHDDLYGDDGLPG